MLMLLLPPSASTVVGAVAGCTCAPASLFQTLGVASPMAIAKPLTARTRADDCESMPLPELPLLPVCSIRTQAEDLREVE